MEIYPPSRTVEQHGTVEHLNTIDFMPVCFFNLGFYSPEKVSAGGVQFHIVFAPSRTFRLAQP